VGWISTSWSQFVQLCFASLVFFTQGVNLTSAAIGLVVVFSVQAVEVVFAVRNRVLNVHHQKIKTDAVTNLSLSFFLFVLFYFDVSFTLNNKAWHSGIFQPFMMVTLATGAAHCLMILIFYIRKNCFDCK
jgi:hypothetical protein